MIFSDGDDRNSLTRRETAMARVQASDAMLYTIGFGAGATVPQLRSSLETYARSTGGRAFFPRQTRELDGIFDEIVAELANQYVLSYSSTNLQAGQQLAQHQGAGAEGQVRHQGAAGLPRSGAAAGREVASTTDVQHRGGSCRYAGRWPWRCSSVRRAPCCRHSRPARPAAVVPQRRRARHHRRQRHRQAGAAAARSRRRPISW